MEKDSSDQLRYPVRYVELTQLRGRLSPCIGTKQNSLTVRSALLSLLHSERPLDDLTGLTLEEAKRVLKQFDGLAVFAPDLEKAIADFNETRRQIREIKKLARGGGSAGGK